MAENVDNSLTLEILKEIRKEQRDQRTLLLQLADANRRLERSMEVRFSTADKSFAALQSRFAAVDQSLGAINVRAGAIEARIGTVDQRIGHLTDDLELMLKSELLGALTHFQNKIEIYVDQRLAERSE
jgi:predicted amino acid-binding ACT domain protein